MNISHELGDRNTNRRAIENNKRDNIKTTLWKQAMTLKPELWAKLTSTICKEALEIIGWEQLPDPGIDCCYMFPLNIPNWSPLETGYWAILTNSLRQEGHFYVAWPVCSWVCHVELYEILDYVKIYYTGRVNASHFNEVRWFYSLLSPHPILPDRMTEAFWTVIDRHFVTWMGSQEILRIE